MWPSKSLNPTLQFHFTVCGDSPVPTHLRTAHKLSCSALFFKTQDIDTGGFGIIDNDVAFLSHLVPTLCRSNCFFLPSCWSLAVYLLLLSQYISSSPIQTATIAVRIKATGISRVMMDCLCLSEAAL